MEDKKAQIVLGIPTSMKNMWVRAAQSEGKKLPQWIIERVSMSQHQRSEPSWKQLVSAGFEVPHGATGFHTKAKGNDSIIVYIVNITEVLPNGSEVISGPGWVEHDLTQEQAQFLKNQKWFGSMGWWFWDCDKRGAHRRAGAYAPWEVQAF